MRCKVQTNIQTIFKMSIAIDIKPSSSIEDAYPTSGLNSLYIPRVFLNITEEKIREVFERLELGEIERIDLVPRPYTSGTISANMAFIYFKYWSQSVSAQNLASRIMDPRREARIVYDDPWYWILLPNRRPHLAKPTESDPIGALKSIIQNLSTRIEILEKNVLFHPDDPFPGGTPILFRQNAENNGRFPQDDPFPGGHPILFRQNAENNGRFPHDDVESNMTHSYEEKVIIPEPPKLHRLVTDAHSFPSSPESIDNSEAREVTEMAHDEQSESSECVYSDDERSVSIDELWVKLRPPPPSNQKKNVSLVSLSSDDTDKRLIDLSKTFKIDENGQRLIRVGGKWSKDNENASCDP